MPLSRALYFWMTWATAWVEPASTANMPLASLLPRYHASMRESSSLSSAPVATVLYSMSLPDFLIESIAPSMRGWMFSEPGVAMNSADLAGADELDDPLAHLDAGQEEVLADVGEAVVVGRVGVVGDDRDAGVRAPCRSAR